jgi:hypothetical protein
MSVSWSGAVLKCVEAFGFFQEGMRYYCFADEGHTFWIHAPFLMPKFGVEQANVSDEYRKYFVIEM